MNTFLKKRNLTKNFNFYIVRVVQACMHKGKISFELIFQSDIGNSDDSDFETNCSFTSSEDEDESHIENLVNIVEELCGSEMNEPVQLKKEVTTRSQPEEESGDSDINEQVDAVVKGIEQGNFIKLCLSFWISQTSVAILRIQEQVFSGCPCCLMLKGPNLEVVTERIAHQHGKIKK